MAANYTAVPDGDVDPESPITTSLMQALRDNPEGIAKAASGAPTIVYAALNLSNDLVAGDIAAGAVGQAEVAGSAIGQAELKTTNGSVSHSGTTAGSSRKTMAGGQYGFYPRTDFDDTGSGGKGWASMIENEGEFGGLVTSITLRIGGGSNGTETVTANQFYIKASPPYDMGDGECGLFIEADVLSDGGLGGLYVAPDPVWANNGPTNIRPDWIDKATGKKYKRVRHPAVTRADVDAGRADLADYIAAMREAQIEDVEIDFAFKNADMGLFPHSWASPPQGTICLLDPVNTHDLLMLHETGEDVAELMHKGYIQIGDEVKRKGPPGVVPVTFKWRNSK